MNMLSTNLKRIMKSKKLTQEDLAKKAGISQVAMHKILVGKTKRPGSLVELALALGTTAEALLSDKAIDLSVKIDNDFSFAYSDSTKIPLISLLQVKILGDILNPSEFENAENWIDWPDKCSLHAYAVRNHGLSMFNTRNGEGYPNNCVLKIEPVSVKPAVDKSDVLVLTPDGKMQFRQMLLDDGEIYLSAINPDWPERIIKMPEGSEIKGVCDGYFMKTDK